VTPSKILRLSALSMAVLGASWALAQMPAYPTTAKGVTPGLFSGNFVAEDEVQLCYIAYGADNPSGDLRGFKVDPPAYYTTGDGALTSTISPDGRYLSWEVANYPGGSPMAMVWAYVIKGGPNYHLYNYLTAELNPHPMDDQYLVSPRSGRNIPQISHYNVCYEKIPEPEGYQGCTPGYWRNHADRWLGVAPTDDFDATFGVDYFTPDITLGTGVQLGGGDINALARHAVAALLNAHGGVANVPTGETVNYPYTVDEVIQLVQDAVPNDTVEATKDLLAAANELGCPLRGTRAVMVP
jgi:hypothetical protein